MATTIPGDGSKRNKLVVSATEEQRTAIDRAVTLYEARHGDDRPITPESRAQCLAMICGIWRALENDTIRVRGEGA